VACNSRTAAPVLPRASSPLRNVGNRFPAGPVHQGGDPVGSRNGPRCLSRRRPRPDRLVDFSLPGLPGGAEVVFELAAEPKFGPLFPGIGRYRDPWYGDVLIDARGGKLEIHLSHTPSLACELERWPYDAFIARWRRRSLGAGAYLTIRLKPDGGIEQARMAPVSPLTDFSFDFQDLRLRPVARMRSRGRKRGGVTHGPLCSPGRRPALGPVSTSGNASKWWPLQGRHLRKTCLLKCHNSGREP